MTTPTTLNPEGLVATQWEFGPVIKGVNYSSGLPNHPADTTKGLSFEIPSGQVGHVNYVTRAVGRTLTAASAIRMKYRIEMEEGAILVPYGSPGFPAMVTLYFQRSGDDWSGTGAAETARWWASFNSHIDLKAGDYEMVAPLSGKWTAVQTSNSLDQSSAFESARASAQRIGFTFGGGTGYGHGVAAAGRVRFILKSFEIE